MAIFTPGPLVAHISGNLGGLNFSRGRGASVIRKRLTRVKRATKAQLAQRALIQAIRSKWEALTDLQRRAWDAAAKSYPLTTRLGTPKYISGWQLFSHVVTSRGQTILWILTDPPLMRLTEQPYDLSFTAQLSGHFTLSWDPHGGVIYCRDILYGARPLRTTPLKRYPVWTYITDSYESNHPWDFENLWYAALGVPAAGEVIAVKLARWYENQLRSHFTQTTATVIP